MGNFFTHLALAFKAFFKTFKDPNKARLFIDGNVSCKVRETADRSHLRLLYCLQHSSRLIDFLKEDISAFSDAQVGSAVRKIHQDCAKNLEELVTIRPLREENEGMLVQVPKGYNPSEIKLVGKITGEPPFTGILMHRGWKAHKLSLPKSLGETCAEVICPAEIEVK